MMLALIGLPGAGKTTVGRQLARRLQVPFLDSDQVIEERIGCSIREFFEREGEQASRLGGGGDRPASSRSRARACSPPVGGRCFARQPAVGRGDCVSAVVCFYPALQPPMN
jgi:hypothetical protein